MNWINRLIEKVLQRGIAGMQRGVDEGIREELSAMLNEMMKKTGMDMSQLSGMIGKAPDFDPYKVLGLDRSAGDEEVKRRYRELLHKLHPDTAGTPGTEFLLQMVVAAYEVIKRERGWS